MSRQIGDRAVVLGASMAGLLAARVLTDVYAQVTVIDRDQLPQACAHRRGVPHGRHLHALLAAGQQALEELLPGLTAELVAHGAVAGDVLDNGRWFLGGHRLRQTRTGLVALCASRPFLEGHVRARVCALPNLTILDRCQVIGLATTTDGRRTTGVRALRRAEGNAGVEEVLGADLVVDATGRGSRTPAWLEALGYPRPPTEQVGIGLGYASRTYRLPPDALGGDLGLLHGSTPQHPRGGALLLVEGGRWIVTLAGMLGDHPSTDPEGFLAFARSLRFPDIYEAVRDAEPLDDPVAFRFPASVRHRYERLRRFPDGLLVVGDAVCSFNPIYGQGMTVAALQALALRRNRRRGAAPQPRRWFREIARVVDVPWDIAVGGDLVFPGVQGRRTLKVRLVNAYLARLHAAAAHDASLAGAFLRVAGLVAPPESLLRPSIVLGVLRARPRPAAGARGRYQNRDAVGISDVTDRGGVRPYPNSANLLRLCGGCGGRPLGPTPRAPRLQDGAGAEVRHPHPCSSCGGTRPHRKQLGRLPPKRRPGGVAGGTTTIAVAGLDGGTVHLTNEQLLRRPQEAPMRSRQQTRTQLTHSVEVQQVYERVLAGASVHSRYVEVGTGNRVHLLEIGAGPPVVLLHAAGTAAGLFLPLQNELAGVRALAPDRPGQGLSDPIDLPPDRYRETAVAWLDGLLDALELDAAALLGNSGGGMWALWYALDRPDRVTRLVLIGPPAVPKTRCPLPVRLMATPGVGELLSRLVPPSPKSMLRFARFIGEGETLAAHPELVDLLVAVGRDPIADRVARAEVRVFASPFALLSRSGFRHRSRVRPDELRRVAVPTLVVWGEQEPLGGVSVAQALAELIPHARLEVLAGGHAPWLGQPAQAAATIVDFVR